MTKEQLEAIWEKCEAIHGIGIIATNGLDADSARNLILKDIPALLAEIDRLQRERDAAVADIKLATTEGEICILCKYYNANNMCDGIKSGCDGSYSGWQWRGAQEGEAHE